MLAFLLSFLVIATQQRNFSFMIQTLNHVSPSSDNIPAIFDSINEHYDPF